MIRPGWKVLAADGVEVGEVDEVAGDEQQDIFDGLAVAEITQGTVRLSITSERARQLGEYLEPATSAEIEPDSKGGFSEGVRAEARELEGDVLAPTQRHEHSMNIWRRVGFAIKRRLGKP